MNAKFKLWRLVAVAAFGGAVSNASASGNDSKLNDDPVSDTDSVSSSNSVDSDDSVVNGDSVVNDDSTGNLKIRTMNEDIIMIGGKICDAKDRQPLNGKYVLFNLVMPDIDGPDNKVTYCGQLANGKAHGNGRYITTKGATYSGEWENGELKYLQVNTLADHQPQ
ncbi:MAG: hypothetical protein LBG13_00610 [Holosporales bacterium]|nr:hypothetical protein [Holosporales bacterium]